MRSDAQATKLTTLPLRTTVNVITDSVVELRTQHPSVIAAILGEVEVYQPGSRFDVQSITHCSTYHFTQQITW